MKVQVDATVSLHLSLASFPRLIVSVFMGFFLRSSLQKEVWDKQLITAEGVWLNNECNSRRQRVGGSHFIPR